MKSIKKNGCSTPGTPVEQPFQAPSGRSAGRQHRGEREQPCILKRRSHQLDADGHPAFRIVPGRDTDAAVAGEVQGNGEGTKFAQTTCGSIRLHLVKIGAVIRRNTRKVYVALSSACPNQELLRLIAAKIIAME